MKGILGVAILIVNAAICQSFRNVYPSAIIYGRPTDCGDRPRYEHHSTSTETYSRVNPRITTAVNVSYAAAVVSGSDYDDAAVQEQQEDDVVVKKPKGKLSRLLARRLSSVSASTQTVSDALEFKGTERVEEQSVVGKQDEFLAAVDQELDESYRKDKQEYDDLFRAKLDEWKELKRLGLLDRLSGAICEEDVTELDEEVSKRRLRRLRHAEKATVEEVSSAAAAAAAMGAHELRAKYLLTKNSSQGLYSLLNEIKDKSLIETMSLSVDDSVHEEDAIHIMEQIMMSIARLDSPHHPVSALKLYLDFIRKGTIDPDRVDSLFLSQYVLQLYTSNLLSAADQCRDLLRLSPVVDVDCMADRRLLTGYICASIHQRASQLLTANKNKADKLQLEQHLLSTIEAQLQHLYGDLRAYPVSEINAVIRVLAKYKLIDRIFSLLSKMRASGVRPNSESLEFLANALVGSVEKGRTASSMRDLPEPLAAVPEIVFVGRSNVGKSSLVNCVLNRKVSLILPLWLCLSSTDLIQHTFLLQALASTSSVPGHTKLFHFFAVNADHPTLPAFRLVDVPGETDLDSDVDGQLP